MDINYDMVDLGLPSGTLWAKCNLGARTETSCGFYFQWSETKGYDVKEVGKFKSFGYDGMKYHTYQNSLKYNKSDKKNRLDCYDDAVTKYMGLSYRMPTEEDFRELFTHTVNSIIRKKGKAVGIMFTSKTNYNKLFFPFNGFAECSRVFAQNQAFLWTSSRDKNFRRSIYANFGKGRHITVGSSPYYGFAIRAVSKKLPN